MLSQSGSFISLFGQTNPVILAHRDGKKRPIRFYLDAGLYENVRGAGKVPVSELALTEGNTIGNRHFRDVLLAKGYHMTYRETGGTHNNLHFRATFPRP